LHPGLQPEPILHAAPRRDRRLSLLLTSVVYGLTAGALFLWVTQRPVQAARSDEGRQTITLTLDDAPSPAALAPIARPAGEVGAGEPEGTHTIDPGLLDQEPMVPVPLRALDPETLPDPLAHPAPPAVDTRLPVAAGGTGTARGAAGGPTVGRGGGHAIIRAVPGMNPGLDLNDLEILHEEIPHYPLLAEWSHVQGDVVVRVTINEKGVPIRTELIEGPPALQSETMRAVKLWRFGSGIFRGRKVDATFDMTFRYILR